MVYGTIIKLKCEEVRDEDFPDDITCSSQHCSYCQRTASVGNSAGLSGSIAGGAEQLFGKKKSKGYEALLEKITTVSAILFIIISIVIVAVFE